MYESSIVVKDMVNRSINDLCLFLCVRYTYKWTLLSESATKADDKETFNDEETFKLSKNSIYNSKVKYLE